MPSHLKGVTRRSFCCKAPVRHVIPVQGRSIERVLGLVCSTCGKPADFFEVINASEERIWPVPPDFEPPADWEPRFPAAWDTKPEISTQKTRKITESD